MRQVFLQKIELPIKTLPNLQGETLDLSPSFQRRDVWNTEKQSRFIESIIMNVPIPPVFLGENEYGHVERREEPPDPGRRRAWDAEHSFSTGAKAALLRESRREGSPLVSARVVA
jgi:hypothetical protein